MRPVTDKRKFKHTIQVRVRNYEVDWQGIVHNGNYLLYFEVGRVEYLKRIGAKVDLNAIQGKSKVVLVRNEIDYKSPAYFDELLNVYTRFSYIKNSSFAMEGLMEKVDNGQRVAFNVAYHVWLDPATNRPTPVDDEFRKLVQRFEGADCEIHWPSVEI
jgi:acyl-CoA thioester hydrolase